MVDTINLLLLQATKWWIPLIYFCSNRQKIDPMVCFCWSQQKHKFISASTTVFPKRLTWCWYCEWLEFINLQYQLCLGLNL